MFSCLFWKQEIMVIKAIMNVVEKYVLTMVEHRYIDLPKLLGTIIGKQNLSGPNYMNNIPKASLVKLNLARKSLNVYLLNLFYVM